MKKNNIRKKILSNTIRVIVILAVILVLVMGLSMKALTENILTDVLTSTIKTASQSVEGNMHMLADRIFMIGDDDVFLQKDSTREEKKAALDKALSGIEFVWLGLYGKDGGLYLGDERCPDTIADREMFPLLEETQNLVVDDVVSTAEGLELAIGTPIAPDGELSYYLVGSYKYDVLNDVLSNINLSVNGKAFIVNKDGEIMGNRDTGLVDGDASLRDIVGIDGITELATSGKTGLKIMDSSRDVDYVSYAPINGTRWYLTVILPESDFMGPAIASIWFSVLVTAVLLVLAILYTLRFSWKIQRSLKGVTERIGLLAQGDLKTPTEVIQTNDETEILSNALNDTVGSINGYISELSEILEEMSKGNFKVGTRGDFDGDFVIMKESLDKIIDFLNDMLRSVKRSSEEVFMTANTVSESAHQVHNGSMEQSDSLNVLSEETKAIEQNILDVDENTKHVSDLMEDVRESMGIGDENMENLLKAMEDINRDSMEITKINKFLEDISFQTNILALNASVEASRSGSAGGGFAIVAREVRDLAAKSAESSKRTSEMIENSLQAVERGTEYARKAAGSFQEVGKTSNEISVITERLTESVDIQKRSLANIAGQITQIREVAHHNLDASSKSTAASQRLDSQAQGLQEISNRFRLKEG